MFRWFAKYRHRIDWKDESYPVGPFAVSPAGRAAIHSDGVVFFHLDTGVLFKSNRIGARIWKGVLNQDRPEAIISQISQEYAVPEPQVARDANRFLAELEAEGFLRVRA